MTQRELAVLAQPFATRAIGSLSRKQRYIQIMSNPNQQQLESELLHSRRTATNRSTQRPRIYPTPFPPAFGHATAYGDYTKRSFEDTRAFVEKLTGVKSFEKAIEIQTEFAKTAYETFVSKSQKIGVLYGDLATQSHKPFGSFVARDASRPIDRSCPAMSKQNSPLIAGLFR